MNDKDATVEELIQGYQLSNLEYCCLFCDEKYHDEEVYPYEEKFLTAKGMVRQHILAVHQSPFHALTQLDKKITGLSEVQLEMMQHFYEETPDQEIVNNSSVNSVSTVRQHRFRLREKERQAKLFIALMQLIKNSDKYMIHKGARQVDERYGIEESEREKTLKTYFKYGLNGTIDTIPRKEKKKIIILQHIISRFDSKKEYSEKEVNEILKNVHTDYVSLRRYLVEYGFMKRNDDGTAYRVNQ